MTVQLGDILGYMDLLGEVDTTNVEPMAHARDMANVFRDDVARPESRSRAGPGQRPAPGRGVLPRPRRAVGLLRNGPKCTIPAGRQSRTSLYVDNHVLGKRAYHHDADRPHRHRSPGRFDRRTNLVRGTDAGLPRSDRSPRRSRAGLLAGRPSGGACPSGRDRSPPGGRSTAGPPGRVAGGDQGRALHARRTDDLRVANPGELPPALRRHRDRPAEGGRCRADRQDEHGRVRHGRVERELGLSPHA